MKKKNVPVARATQSREQPPNSPPFGTLREITLGVEYEVTAVEKPYGVLGHDSITAIGNDRDRWSISTPSAILRIVKRRDAFYVTDPTSGHRVYLTAVRDKFGRASLRAMTEGRATNHLLALKPLRDSSLID